MKIQDPFGFAKAIQVPKDKKTIDKVHKLLFKKKMKKKIKKEIKEAFIPAGMDKLWAKQIEHKKHYPFGDD